MAKMKDEMSYEDLADLLVDVPLDAFTWFQRYCENGRFTIHQGVVNAIKYRYAKETAPKKSPGRPRSSSGAVLAVSLCPSAILKLGSITEATGRTESEIIEFAVQNAPSPSQTNLSESRHKHRGCRAQIRVACSLELLALIDATEPDKQYIARPADVIEYALMNFTGEPTKLA